MGTFIKYMIYISLIVIVYFIAKEVWNDNSNNTVEEVVVGVENPQQSVSTEKQ